MHDTFRKLVGTLSELFYFWVRFPEGGALATTEFKFLGVVREDAYS